MVPRPLRGGATALIGPRMAAMARSAWGTPAQRDRALFWATQWLPHAPMTHPRRGAARHAESQFMIPHDSV